ncbi:MAG: GTP diphosphokinase [Gammaproteobacteria bacterium]
MVNVNDNSAAAPGATGVDVDAWVETVASQRPDSERQVIGRAARLAVAAHGSQRRVSGEPYVQHVFAVAQILAALQLDHETIAAAILHDVVEDTDVTLEQVTEQFGPAVARLVDGVTKMSVMSEYPAPGGDDGRRQRSDAESLRKMLLAMVEDVRVVLIKLADRLHNMRTLKHLSETQRARIARETLDIFAPLANRLGIWQLKWELEDLSLRYLEPEAYQRIAKLLDERRVDRERYIDNVVRTLRAELEKAGIKAEVSGRPKHIYSIWKKMQRKEVAFDEIFDVRAVRIFVNTVAECYGALGIVHTLWRHIPREFDDYIATPKENQYQSLHTAVIGPGGRTLEVQIRTHEMHAHSELGVAAHWRYKEGGRYDAGFEQKIAWLRQLLEWKDEEDSAGEFVDRFKAEVFEDRVYVLTPAGNVVDLPKGATPLDFAYHIHTDVGHRCRGAKANGSMVQLTYELKTGDQVEILTARGGTPSRDWLNPHLGYLRTSRARAKVRAWFKQQDQEKNVAAGRAALDRELHRLGAGDVNLEKLAKRFRFPRVDEFLAAVGRGDVTSGQIAGAAQELLPAPAAPPAPIFHPRRRGARGAPGDVKVVGVGNLLTSIARCCKPVPNEPIVGYITRGHGVTIHRSDCPNALRLQQQARERLIEVSWGTQTESTYPVDIQVLAYDRQGLLRDVTAVFSNEKVNVLSLNTVTDRKDHMAHMRVTLELHDVSQLSRVLDKIGQLANVVEARRLR